MQNKIRLCEKKVHYFIFHLRILINFFKNVLLTNRPTDYFSGEIKQNKSVISKVYGTYLGFIEFDEVRYWDITENVYLKSFENPNQIQSSSLFREDRIYLEKQNLEKGQLEKDRLENIQRHDRKLREAYQKQLKKTQKK